MDNQTLFCTKILARYTGLSTSFFEKGRVYHYGPPYRKLRGRVLYKKSEVDAWIEAHRTDPEYYVDGGVR